MNLLDKLDFSYISANNITQNILSPDVIFAAFLR